MTTHKVSTSVPVTVTVSTDGTVTVDVDLSDVAWDAGVFGDADVLTPAGAYADDDTRDQVSETIRAALESRTAHRIVLARP